MKGACQVSTDSCVTEQKNRMFCTLWIIFQTLAFVAEGGSSESAEAAAAKAAANNGGAAAAAGNNANQGGQNGAQQQNGQVFLAKVVQAGGSFILQPLGAPIEQPAVQQVLPASGSLQQGGLGFFVAQAGGANGIPQQGQQLAQSTNGGSAVVPLQLGHSANGGGLLTILPQTNAIGSPQNPFLFSGQQVQLIPLNAVSNNQQQQLTLTGQDAAGRLRIKRSLVPRLRRTPEQPSGKPTTAAEEKEEECSGAEGGEAQQQIMSTY